MLQTWTEVVFRSETLTSVHSGCLTRVRFIISFIDPVIFEEIQMETFLITSFLYWNGFFLSPTL